MQLHAWIKLIFSVNGFEHLENQSIPRGRIIKVTHCLVNHQKTLLVEAMLFTYEQHIQ